MSKDEIHVLKSYEQINSIKVEKNQMAHLYSAENEPFTARIIHSNNPLQFGTKCSQGFTREMKITKENCLTKWFFFRT